MVWYFLVQGGPLTIQESPVSFPKKLYRRIHNATVISGSMDWSIYQCFLVLTANNRVPPSVQVDSQLAFLRDSLKLIQRLWLKLFRHDDLSSVTWGTTNTEHFLMTILRQHGEVKRCVSQQTVTVQLTPTHPISIAPSDLDTGTPPVSTVGKLVVFECSDTQWNSLKPTQEWDVCWEGVVSLARIQMFQWKSSMKNWKGLSSGVNLTFPSPQTPQGAFHQSENQQSFWCFSSSPFRQFHAISPVTTVEPVFVLQVSKKRKADSQLVKYYSTLERRMLHQKVRAGIMPVYICAEYKAQALTAVLRPQANRTESWELIRRETQLHLEQLHMLVASIISRWAALRALPVDAASSLITFLKLYLFICLFIIMYLYINVCPLPDQTWKHHWCQK